MAVDGVTSNNVPATPVARAPEPRPPVRQAEAAPAPAPKPGPSVNTSGQTTGTRISTSA